MESSEAVIRRGAFERVRNPETEGHLQAGRYVPLLYLLEHPLPEVQRLIGPALLDAGFDPALVRSLSLSHLVAYALRSGSGYWAELALGWLDEGLPLDEEVVAAAEVVASEGAGQRLRHRASGVVVRWRRSRDGAA